VVEQFAQGRDVMTKRTIVARLRTAIAAAVMLATGTGAALAAGEAPHIAEQEWSFAGPFGSYDPAQLQRGFKVYREVCSACHGIKRVAFRNLEEPGGPLFSEAAARQIATEYTVIDGPNADGEMFERPARLSDRFPPPYPNEEAARAAQGGAYPPDLSLMAKARAAHRGFPWFVLDIFTQYQEGGPDYIYALLTGYEEPPEGVEVPPGMYYNNHFLAGKMLAMPNPLSDDQVEYTDGAPQTVDQYSRDVAAFLMWTAEPKLDERKQIGFKAMIFMVIFAGALYVTKRRLWDGVAH
jgi:ubiquinol-cytochrome c reductase cytochrome b/c1 subunit